MLHTGHGELLGTAGQRRAEFSEMMGVVAVSLLDATPRRMTGQVDAHPTEEVSTLRPNLAANRFANLLLKLHIPRRTTRHRHRKGRSVAGNTPSRPIDEPDPWDTQPSHLTMHVGPDVVALGDQLT